jgi:hypothetical protein
MMSKVAELFYKLSAAIGTMKTYCSDWRRSAAIGGKRDYRRRPPRRSGQSAAIGGDHQRRSSAAFSAVKGDDRHSVYVFGSERPCCTGRTHGVATPVVAPSAHGATEKNHLRTKESLRSSPKRL